MTARFNRLFSLLLRDRCVPAPAQRLRCNDDLPPRPPSPVVIISESPKSDASETLTSSVDNDEALMQDILHLMYPGAMKTEGEDDVFVDAAEDAYEKSNGVSGLCLQRNFEDDDSESSFSVRYHLPAWPSPDDALASPLSTVPTASSVGGSLHSSMSGHTCVPEAPALQNAFTPVATTSQTLVVTTFEPKSPKVRGKKAALPDKGKNPVKTGTRPELRDVVPETKSREEIFENGVPWGFHGRDYLPPLPKKHCLRETVKDLPLEPIKKARLFRRVKPFVK